MAPRFATHIDAILLFAQQLEESAEPRPRLDPGQRLQLLSALALVLILGAVAVLIIRATGRFVRWYGGDRGTESHRKRLAPDLDDWAQKPLTPPLDDETDAETDDDGDENDRQRSVQ